MSRDGTATPISGPAGDAFAGARPRCGGSDTRLAKIVEALRRKRTDCWREPDELPMHARIARVLREPADDSREDEPES